jgi:hypothetical protein
MQLEQPIYPTENIILTKPLEITSVSQFSLKYFIQNYRAREGMSWIHLAQVREKRWVLLKTQTKLLTPRITEIFFFFFENVSSYYLLTNNSAPAVSK